MKKTFYFKTYVGISFFLLFQTLSAQESNYSDWSVAPMFGYKQIKSLSIYDLGVVVTRSIAEGHRVNLELSQRLSEPKLDQNWGSIPMNMKADISSLVAGVGYNWFPFVTSGSYGDFLNSITVMGGMWYVNKPEYSFDASLRDPLSWGDFTFSKEEIGSVATTIKTNKVQPYVGLGYNQFCLGGQFSVVVNGGVLYQGKPEVAMVATNMLRSTVESAARFEDNLGIYQFAPFAQLSFNYNF